ncbi:MAG: hypothetical protein ACNA7V_09420 [Bacteroidales bacterium]
MTERSGYFGGKWKKGNRQIEVSLPLIIFEDGGNQVVFCPALDISAAGKTDQEAMIAFETALGEYLLYTTNKKTFNQDLKSHGWTVKKSVRKPMIPPDMSYLLQNNDEFNRVFNTRDFRKVNHSVEMPAFA